jgi:hypothetical protein
VDQARAAGAWTPAQIVEHIVLAYEYSTDVVKGTATGGCRGCSAHCCAGWSWTRRSGGKVHQEGQGASGIPPVRHAGPRSELLDRLDRAVTVFESAPAILITRKRGTASIHPAFGSLPTVDYVRLQAIPRAAPSRAALVTR